MLVGFSESGTLQANILVLFIDKRRKKEQQHSPFVIHSTFPLILNGINFQ